MDVAGGRGLVSFELQCKHGVPATLLDTAPARLTKSQRKALRKRQCAMFGHVEALISPAFAAGDRGATLLSGCGLLVGMHPDEATEAIIDAALKFGKPFAVLPCCVFPQLFPDRVLADGGGPVVTYSQFISYLQNKAADIECAHLPFAGRNQVLFRRGGAACHPQPDIELAWGGEVEARNRRRTITHDSGVRYWSSRTESGV